MSSEENNEEREITVARKKRKGNSVVLNRCALDRRLTRYPLTQCVVCTLKFWYECTFLWRFVTIYCSKRCTALLSAVVTEAGFKCSTCATPAPAAAPALRSRSTPAPKKRRSTSIVGTGSALLDLPPEVIGAPSSTVTTRSAASAAVSANDPMSAFDAGSMPLSEQIARLPALQREHAESVVLGATQPLNNPDSVLTARYEQLLMVPAPNVMLIDLAPIETEINVFREIATKEQIFKLADRTAARDDRPTVQLEDFIDVCENFDRYTSTLKKHLPNLWNVMLIVINGGRSGSNDTPEQQALTATTLLAPLLRQVSREFNTLPMLFSLYLHSMNVPSATYHALQGMKCGFVSRKTLVRMLTASGEAMAARLRRGVEQGLRYNLFWDNIDYQLLRQRASGSHIQWCVAFFAPRTYVQIGGEPTAALCARDALELGHIMPTDAAHAELACRDVLRCVLARARGAVFESLHTEASVIAVCSSAIIGMPLIEKAQTKNEDAADALRAMLQQLEPMVAAGTLIGVYGDNLSDRRAYSASTLGDRPLRLLRPMVALWHVNNRGNLPGLLRLLGDHWQRLVVATGHTRTNEMSGDIDSPNAKTCDRLLRVVVLEMMTRAVVSYKRAHKCCGDAGAVDGVVRDLLDGSVDDRLRADGKWSMLRARTFVVLFVLAYQELDASVARAQSARLLRSLRWSLVLLYATGHTAYAHSVIRMLVNLTAVLGRADAAAFIAGHFVNTGNGRCIASDCFVELMIARIEAMMGTPTSARNTTYLRSIAASVIMLDALRRKCHTLFRGTDERRGRNEGSPEFVARLRGQVRVYIETTSLRVLSTDTAPPPATAGATAVVDVEENVLALDAMIEKTTTWASNHLAQFHRGEPDEPYVSRAHSTAQRAANAAAMGDNDDGDGDDESVSDDDAETMRNGEKVQVDECADDNDNDDDDATRTALTDDTDDLIPVAIHSFRELGSLLAFDR
jgi:hypothetical protein